MARWRNDTDRVVLKYSYTTCSNASLSTTNPTTLARITVVFVKPISLTVDWLYLWRVLRVVMELEQNCDALR
jgi:hypothetical protein